MRPEFRLDQRLQQRIVMTPMLQQALKILQLSTLELREWIDKEMMENPVLEEVDEDTPAEPEKDKQAGTGDASASATEEPTSEPALAKVLESRNPDIVDKIRGGTDFEPETWAEDDTWGDERRESNGSDFDQEKRDYLEASVTREATLWEQLEWQLSLAALSEEDRDLGKVLIGHIDDNGYLSTPLEEIAKRQRTPASRAERILKVIQTFEPTGVGARDLRECLLLQLENKTGEVARTAYEVLLHHFEDLEKRRFQPLQKALCCSNERFWEVLDLIYSLEPKPGRSFGGEKAQTVIPDVTVEFVEGNYIILLNDDEVPRLRISPYYRRLLKEKNVLNRAEAKAYLDQKIHSAQWLIKNIEQRRKTIYRVTEAIFKIQRDFLDKGIAFLKPLTLKQVAEMVGMHESTISRVTTRKYVQTPRGLFELKFFFSSGLESESGLDVSSLSVKDMIQDLVKQEAGDKPLSDQKIMQMLKSQGVSIARRTIAKYREEMHVPPASHRRKIR
jgi:RNA polymerase sigma-54 factor